MGEPIKELTRDAFADGNGYDALLTKFATPPVATPGPYDALLQRFEAPVQSAPKTYDDILTGFMRGGTAMPTVPPAEEATPSPEIVSQWPPAAAVSTAEAATGPAPPVGPLEKPPGLIQRVGKSIAGSLSKAFGGGPTPEQQMAERAFGAQAELEAREHPDFNNLLTDNAKLRFLNIFRRRYQLPPLNGLPPPETAPEVVAREFKSWRGLVGKLPYVSTLALGIDAYQLVAAASRMDAGTGTIDDFELLTKAKETEARESRGKTVAGTGVDILGQSIPVGLEYATGGGPTRLMAKGAEKLVGKTVSSAVSKAAMKVAEAASEKTLPRLAVHAAVKTAERGLPSWATRTAVETLQRQVPGYELRPGDDAALEYAMTAPPQPLLEALRDSAVHQGIQVVSEFTGASVGIIGGKLGRLAAGAERVVLPSLKAVEWAGKLRTAIATELVTRFPNKYLTISSAMQMLTNKAGYNGVFGEIGEERIGELMEAAAKEVIAAGGDDPRLQGLEGNPIWQMPKAGEPWPGWKQLQAEFMGFLIPGTVTAGVSALMPEEAKPFERRQPPGAPLKPGEAEIPPPGHGVPEGEVPPGVHIPVREAGQVPRETPPVVGAGLKPTSLTATEEEPLSEQEPKLQTVEMPKAGLAGQRGGAGTGGDGLERGPEIEAAEEEVAPAVAAIHLLADQEGIPWDNDTAFMAFTERLTGKRHLDELDPAELAAVRDAIEAGKRPEPQQPGVPVRPELTTPAPPASLTGVIDKSNAEVDRSKRIVDRLTWLLLRNVKGRPPTTAEVEGYKQAYIWDLRRALLKGGDSQSLWPDNKKTRTLYEAITGRTLPKGLEATRKYLTNNPGRYQDDITLLMALDEYVQENKLGLPLLKEAEQRAIRKTTLALPPVPEPPREEKPPKIEPIAPIGGIIKGETPHVRPTEQPKPRAEREPEPTAERQGGEPTPGRPRVGGPSLPEGRAPKDVQPPGESGAPAPVRPRAPSGGGGVDRPPGGERHEAGAGVRDRGGAVPPTAGVVSKSAQETYDAARAAYAAASKEYHQTAARYRKGDIDNDYFLAAKGKFNEANQRQLQAEEAFIQAKEEKAEPPSKKIPAEKKEPPEEPERPEVQVTHTVQRSGLSDYSITDPTSLFVSGKKSIFKRNVEAIRTLKKIQEENRAATEDEKAVLVRYQGWGSVSEAFRSLYGTLKNEWSREGEELGELLTDEEYAAARSSTLNAMYTPPEIVQGMWEALRRMGFLGGAVLETSAGVGHFLGLQPLDMADASRRVAIEKDTISAGIAAALYPASDVRHSPFEEAALPKDYFDVAISNVPFGQLFIKDKRYPKGLREFIHDYFFVRGLDLVHPGGIVAFITTKGTMDKLSEKVRAYLGERADLIGAVRLNEDSLPGTKVTADILFLRKRGEGEAPGGEAWLHSKPYEALKDRWVNEYFQKHPEMVLGTIKAGSQYTSEDAPTNTIVEAPEGFDLARDLEIALSKLPRDLFGKVEGGRTDRIDPLEMVPSPDDLPAGALFVGSDGALRRAQNRGEPSGNVERSLLEQHGPKAVQRVKGLVELRDGVLEVLRASVDPKGDERLPALQKKINEIYDRLGKDGITPIHATANGKLLAGDPLTFSLLGSVENYDRATKTGTKGDIFTRRMLEPYRPPSSAENTSDALSIALDESNRVDLSRIAELLGVEEATAKTRLIEESLVYEMPAEELVLASDYLSGNVRAKLRDAEGLAKMEDRYKRNVEALKAVQPEDKPPSRIAPVIGAPWIPAETIEDFMVSILGEKVRRSISVRRGNATGRWFVSAPSWTATGAAATETWGTKDMDFVELIKAKLSMKSPRVTEKFTDADDTKRERVNPEATAAAEAKLAEINAYFETWLWSHKKWGPHVLRVFNEEMNNTAPRKWDGSHLTFPGMNPQIKLDPHQKDGVYRAIASPNNTLLAVAVGGGKTFMLTAAAMETLRLRLARKVAIVVERATLNQFIKQARLLYPGGNFIALSASDLQEKNRAATLARVAAAERTVFIIPHKQFTMLPVGEATLRSYYDEMIEAMEESIADMSEDSDKASKKSVKQMEKARDNLQARMEERIEDIRRTPTLTFEELGLDWIMYDESQKVKNLGFQTQLNNVRGLGHPAGNQITTDLYVKARYVQKLQNGRGVVFSTGTPIDNSISEIYAIQRYLQPEKLREIGISSFDDWVRMFALPAADLERVAGRYKMVTRLREYLNLHALYQMWDEIAHFVAHEAVSETLAKRVGSSPMPIFAMNSRGKRTYELVVLEATPAQIEYRKVIAQRVRDLKPRPKSGDDIMLSIISDEKKAALDMRLVLPGLAEEPGNKIAATAERAAAIYKEGHKHRYTQLIFVNQGPPGSKVGFALYSALIEKIVGAGVPRDQIATIYDAQKDEQKQALFEKVNRGDLRILIGSMAKMGTGVNVQERVLALQQMEPAWTPALLTQMEGRPIRQGNINWGDPTKPQEVRMYRYVSKGSSDEFMYSLLAAKQKVISEFLSGRLDADRIQDVDIGFASFQLAMAESSENKTVLEWTKADQQLRTLQGQLRYHRDAQMDLRKKELRTKAIIEKTAEDLKAAKRIADWAAGLPPAKPFTMSVRGKEYDKMGEAGAALFESAKSNSIGVWTPLGTFRGVGVAVKVDGFGQSTAHMTPPADMRSDWDRLAHAPPTVGGVGTIPSEGQLRAWIMGLTDMLMDVSPAAYAARLATAKEELAEIGRNIDKPFGKQKELDQLAAKVRKLTDEIAAVADQANKAAEGGAAEDMGDQEGEEEDEDGEGPRKPEPGGGGISPGFGKREESLLPPNMTPEYRAWVTENWGGNVPLFGMGAMGAGNPALTGLRGWYVRSWEKWVSKPWFNRKTAKGQAISNAISGSLWDLGWNMSQATRNEFERAKGASAVAAEYRANLDERLNRHVGEVREKGIGAKWPETAWKEIKSVAKAVLGGGHNRPENMPPDMRAVWKEHFASWVKKQSGRGVSREEYEASIEARLAAVQERIDKIHDTTIGHAMPKEGWDVYALTEHALIEEVARGKRPYEDISPAMREWLGNAKSILDELTDEILSTPWLLKMAQLGGLENWKEIVEARKASGLIYLQRLYNYHQKKRHPVRSMVWAEHKLLGPRLALGMFKAKRADEKLWTVRKANLQERQFDSPDAAKAFADQEIERNQARYGEMVKERVKIIPPLEDEQVEWLGPVKDMRILLGSTITSLMKNVAFGKLFHYLNETEAISEAEYNDLDEGEQMRYRQLPDTPKLWDLANKYVPAGVEDAINEMDLVFTGFLSQYWRSALNAFRSIVVLTSTTTWINQVLGQTFTWMLAGLNPLTHKAVFIEAAKRLSNGVADPTVKNLLGMNALRGGWDRNGVGAKASEFISAPHGQVVGGLIDLYLWAKKAGHELGKGYGFIDEVSIVASWIRDREVLGLPEEIATENLRWFQNYNRLGQAAKWLRVLPFGDPFAAFSDQAIKITIKGMREHPGRVLAYYALPGVIHLTSRLLLGVTDDEMKILNTSRSRDAQGPFGWLQGWNDRYFQPILPLPRDKQGRLHTMDMRYLYWLGNEMRVATGPGGIGIPHIMRQPLFGPLAELWPNVTAYGGREIMDRNDPAIVQLWDAAKHVAWGSIPAPKLATRSPFRIYEAATGRSGENLIKVLLKEVFGINILPQYASREEAFRLIKEAYGVAGGHRWERLLTFYERYAHPKSAPITERGLRQSIASDERKAEEP